MYWFRRPPYVRWAAAAVLVVLALAVELRPESRAGYPFAARALAPGEVLAETDLEWRSIPDGLLPDPDLSGGVVARTIAAGSPLVAGDVTGAALAPADWWSVPVEMPAAAPGTAVRIVLVSTGQTVDGVVITPPDDDPYSLTPAALVAVPGPAASAVAAAVAQRDAVVLVGHDGVGSAQP